MGITIDEDLYRQAKNEIPDYQVFITALLMQILRELRKEGPEEKSAPVKGFTA